MSGEGSAGVSGEGVWAFVSMQGEECEEEGSLGVSGEEVWVVQLAEGSAFCRGQLYSQDLLNEQQIPPSKVPQVPQDACSAGGECGDCLGSYERGGHSRCLN